MNDGRPALICSSLAQSKRQPVLIGVLRSIPRSELLNAGRIDGLARALMVR